MYLKLTQQPAISMWSSVYKTQSESWFEKHLKETRAAIGAELPQTEFSLNGREPKCFS